jgi:methionyl-tRNA formyltransferase
VPIAPAPAHPRRLVFLGTPAFAAEPLRALVDAGHEVALVVSQPDKRRGRGGKLVPSPVKQAALDLGLPVADRVDDTLDAGADLGVVAAFGRLIKPHVLERLPMVNLHFSLLPRWRGAAPVERAILAGDERTGVDLMVVEEGLDTGGIYDRAEVDIGPDETADELRARLAALGSSLLLRNLADGLGTPRPQEGEPTYAPTSRWRCRRETAAAPCISWRSSPRAAGACPQRRGPTASTGTRPPTASARELDDMTRRTPVGGRGRRRSSGRWRERTSR